MRRPESGIGLAAVSIGIISILWKGSATAIESWLRSNAPICKLELRNLAHFTVPRKSFTSSQKNSFVSRISGFLTGNFAPHLGITIVDR
jgi:hypothetical protein